MANAENNATALEEGEIDLTDGKRLCLKKILTPGEGNDGPEKGDDVTVHYTGRLLDGSVFDSSVERGDKFKFKLGVGQVIKGWDTGVASMRRGEKAILTCAPSYAYGAAGSPPKIPPGATLKFEVELFGWKSSSDLTDDGGVRKKVKAEGDGWEQPKDMWEVDVHMEAHTADGRLLHSTRAAAPVSFVVGDAAVAKGISIGIKSMKKGERVTLLCTPQYTRGGPLEVPDNFDIVYDVELVSWRKVEEVAFTEGGVVLKHLNDIPGYDTAIEGTRVVANYSVRTLGGQLVESADGAEFVSLGGDLLDGLELAVEKMRKGEHLIATVAGRFAYGPEGRPPLVGPNETVQIEIEVLSLDNKPPAMYTLKTVAEKLPYAALRREEGNKLFKKGSISRAEKKYEKAIEYFRTDLPKATDEEKAKIQEITTPCHSNMAACQLKMGEDRKAIDNCKKVLEVDPDNVKALFRQAQGYMAIKEYDGADAAFTRVLELDPDNKVAAKEVARARKLAGAERVREKAVYSKMFG